MEGKETLAVTERGGPDGTGERGEEDIRRGNVYIEQVISSRNKGLLLLLASIVQRKYEQVT